MNEDFYSEHRFSQVQQSLAAVVKSCHVNTLTKEQCHFSSQAKYHHLIQISSLQVYSPATSPTYHPT